MDISKHIALTFGYAFRAGDTPERVVTYGAALSTWVVLDGASDGKRLAISIFVFMILLVLTLCWKEIARRHSEPRIVFERDITPMLMAYKLIGSTDSQLGSAQLYLSNKPAIRREASYAKGACVQVKICDLQNLTIYQASPSICPWADNINSKRFDQRTLDLSPSGISYGFYPLLLGGGVYVARPNDFYLDGAQTTDKQKLTAGTYLMCLEVLAENMDARPTKWFRLVITETFVEVKEMILGLNLDHPAERELWLSLDGDIKTATW